MNTANESDLLILSLIIECSILAMSVGKSHKDKLGIKHTEWYNEAACMCLLTDIHIHIIKNKWT